MPNIPRTVTDPISLPTLVTCFVRLVEVEVGGEAGIYLSIHYVLTVLPIFDRTSTAFPTRSGGGIDLSRAPLREKTRWMNEYVVYMNGPGRFFLRTPIRRTSKGVRLRWQKRSKPRGCVLFFSPPPPFKQTYGRRQQQQQQHSFVQVWIPGIYIL